MILDDDNPMFQVISELTEDLGHMDLDLNLIVDPRESDREIWQHIEKTYDFDERSSLPISCNGYFDSGETYTNPLIAWFEGDTTLIREFEQKKYNEEYLMNLNSGKRHYIKTTNI